MFLPTEKTHREWINEFSWLEFNAANLIICKLCHWRAEQNGIVMCNTGRFVQGSSKYILYSGLQDNEFFETSVSFCRWKKISTDSDYSSNWDNNSFFMAKNRVAVNTSRVLVAWYEFDKMTCQNIFKGIDFSEHFLELYSSVKVFKRNSASWVVALCRRIT